MLRKMNIFFKRRVKRFFAHTFSKITQINKKYKKPQIEMKPSVRITLTMLVFYLVFLIGMLIYKFIITLSPAGRG